MGIQNFTLSELLKFSTTKRYQLLNTQYEVFHENWIYVAEDATYNFVYYLVKNNNVISSTYHSVVANYITCQNGHEFLKFSN